MTLSRAAFVHVAALAIFVLVAGLWAAHARDKNPGDLRNSDTTRALYGVVMDARTALRQQPTALSITRSVYSDVRTAWEATPLSELYQASFVAYLRGVYMATGDVMDAYRILVFPLNLIFLVGAYLLFLHITGLPRLAIALSLLSSLPIFLPIAGEQFGMGPVTIFSRRHLFTAFTPWIIWLFYRYRLGTVALVMAFALAGLAANLHASGILLIEILLIAYLLQSKAGMRQIGIAASCVAVIPLAACVAVGSIWGQMDAFAHRILGIMIPSAYAATDAVKQIPASLQYLFYPPHIYSALPRWTVDVMAMTTGLAAIAPLALRTRLTAQRYADLLFFAGVAVFAFLSFSETKYWIVFGTVIYLLGERRPADSTFELTHLLVIATFVVSFLGMTILQVAFILSDDMPLVFNQVRGVRFLGLFVFVWVAVLARDLRFRRVRGSMAVVAATLTLALLWDFRSLLRDNFRITAAQTRTQQLMLAANWAKHNSDAHATFMIDSWAFGIVSERAVYAGDKGHPYLAEFKADPPSLMRFASDIGMDYMVIERWRATQPPVTRVVYENAHYAIARLASH